MSALTGRKLLTWALAAYTGELPTLSNTLEGAAVPLCQTMCSLQAYRIRARLMETMHS